MRRGSQDVRALKMRMLVVHEVFWTRGMGLVGRDRDDVLYKCYESYDHSSEHRSDVHGMNCLDMRSIDMTASIGRCKD